MFHTVHVERFVATFATARSAVTRICARSGTARSAVTPAPSAVGPGTAAISCRTAFAPNAPVSEVRQAARIWSRERAGFFGRAGVEVGLAGELMAGRAGRIVAVLAAVGAHQAGVAGFDPGPPRREMPDHPERDTADLAHRFGVPPGVRPGHEVHAQPLGERGLERGVVTLGRGDRDPVQGAGIQRPPLPVDALDLAGDGHMGMQVRVAVARVVVVERRRDQAPGPDLGDAARAGPGEGGMVFQQFERSVFRVLMRLADRGPHPGPLIQRPQQHRAFDRREHRIEPRHGGPLAACFLPVHLLDLRLGRIPAGLFGDDRQPPSDPRAELLQRLIRRERAAQGRGPDRLPAAPGQLRADMPGRAEAARWVRIIASPSGCWPWPNSARICSSVTCCPASPSSGAPRPIHVPGGLPLAV